MPVSERGHHCWPRRELGCVFISHDQIAANPRNKYIARKKSFENVRVQIGLFEAGSKHLKFRVECSGGYFRENLADFQVRIIFLFSRCLKTDHSLSNEHCSRLELHRLRENLNYYVSWAYVSCLVLALEESDSFEIIAFRNIQISIYRKIQVHCAKLHPLTAVTFA